MKIDYNNLEFTQDEINYMLKETDRLYETNPNHIPVLIQLDSNVLKMDKQKFLISNNINFNDFINHTLKKKLINLYSNDIIIINVVKNSDSPKLQEIIASPKQLKEIYEEYKDNATNLLILRISRKTTYKLIRGYLGYLTGY